MNLQQLNAFFAAHPHIDQERWMALGKPCVDIAIKDESPALENSRFGGPAWLPPDISWPQAEIGWYEFLGQINFSEIAQPPDPLPSNGLLSLFFNMDEEGEVFWGDDGFIYGIYIPEMQNCIVTMNPHNVQGEPYYPQGFAGLKLSLSTGIDVPISGYLQVDWPEDKDMVLSALGGRYDDEGWFQYSDHLLGYPVDDSFGYDPRPEYRDNADGQWFTLLSASSHEDSEELRWQWGDGGKLMVFIEAAALARRDFTHLKSDAG